MNPSDSLSVCLSVSLSLRLSVSLSLPRCPSDRKVEGEKKKDATTTTNNNTSTCKRVYAEARLRQREFRPES